MTLGRSSKAWSSGTWSWEASKCYSVFFFQFNYMHECFERVFCELKWRKEVILNNLELTFSSFFVCLFKMYSPVAKYLGPSSPSV